jgi:hypothetical protein
MDAAASAMTIRFTGHEVDRRLSSPTAICGLAHNYTNLQRPHADPGVCQPAPMSQLRSDPSVRRGARPAPSKPGGRSGGYVRASPWTWSCEVIALSATRQLRMTALWADSADLPVSECGQIRAYLLRAAAPRAAASGWPGPRERGRPPPRRRTPRQPGPAAGPSRIQPRVHALSRIHPHRAAGHRG